MENEFPIWRIVKSGVPLSEVSKWDLEDIDKWHAIAEMDRSYEMAYEAYHKAQQNQD